MSERVTPVSFKFKCRRELDRCGRSGIEREDLGRIHAVRFANEIHISARKIKHESGLLMINGHGVWGRLDKDGMRGEMRSSPPRIRHYI